MTDGDELAYSASDSETGEDNEESPTGCYGLHSLLVTQKNGEEEAGHEDDELQQRDTIFIAKRHLGSRGAAAVNMAGRCLADGGLMAI